MRSLVALLALCLPFAAPSGASDAAALAREAAAALDRAGELLAEARGAPDRIAALTSSVRGYEAGLAALREGLRAAHAEEAELRAELKKAEGRTGKLVSVLHRLGGQPPPAVFVHPEGPLATVRAGMLISALASEADRAADEIAENVARLQDIVALRRAATDRLETAAEDARNARRALADAAAAGNASGAAQATDAAALEALLNSSETLSAFADTFAAPDRPDDPLRLSAPTDGIVIRAFGTPRADGSEPQGLDLRTEPGALVTAPALSTVRFSGDVPGEGGVVILEPAPGQIVILAGLGQPFVARGKVVEKGAPLGLMPEPPAQEILITADAGAGQPSGERLYIEVRHGQTPVDPETVMALGEQ